MKTYSINDNQNLEVILSDYGARIIDILISGCSIVCGYSQSEDYLEDNVYMGATIGPIANRIRRGKLSIEGVEFQLPQNEGQTCLHSGSIGLDKVHWEIESTSGESLVLSSQPDSIDNHLPGRPKFFIRYSVCSGQLKIDYFADTEFATYLNLSNHVYLNLNPKTNGCKQNIRNHRFTLFANAYTINDAEFIPTDRLQNMSNPFQYSSSDKNQRNGLTSKVDSHFITKDDALDLELIPIVDVSSPDSNIGVKISSTKPGFQFYTGHFLSAPFSPFDGFCIEPQYIPNAINREQHCSPLTLPETPYRHTTVFEFRQGQS